MDNFIDEDPQPTPTDFVPEGNDETPETMEDFRNAFAGCALTSEEQEIIFGLYS